MKRLKFSMFSRAGRGSVSPGHAPSVVLRLVEWFTGMSAATPLAQPADAVGCYHDHDPHAGSMGPAYVGARLLKFGIPGCSGAWGCGTGPNNIKDCPAWPAALEKCSGNKATPECEPPTCLVCSWIAGSRVSCFPPPPPASGALCVSAGLTLAAPRARRLCHNVQKLGQGFSMVGRRWLGERVVRSPAAARRRAPPAA